MQLIDNSKTFLCFEIMFFNAPDSLRCTWFFNNIPDWPQVLFLSPSPFSPSACDQICSRHSPTSFLQDLWWSGFYESIVPLWKMKEFDPYSRAHLWGWESTSASSEARRERQKPFLLWKVTTNNIENHQQKRNIFTALKLLTALLLESNKYY